VEAEFPKLGIKEMLILFDECHGNTKSTKLQLLIRVFVY